AGGMYRAGLAPSGSGPHFNTLASLAPIGPSEAPIEGEISFLVCRAGWSGMGHEAGMLSVYVPQGSSLERIPVASRNQVPDSAVWFDLIQPTQLEDKLVESVVGISVPTREEMQEIEVTSRLYVENGARYMTATRMCQSGTDTPKTTAVTFILSGHRLITVRYDEPRPFLIVGNKLGRVCPAGANGESVLMELLDAVIDRAADILERIGAEVDRVSHDIFEPEAEQKLSHQEILKSIGPKGDR